MMKRPIVHRAIYWATTVILVLTILYLIETYRQCTMEQARNQATLRELGAFHLDYLRKNGLSEDDYRTQLIPLAKKHENWVALQDYVKYVSSKAEARRNRQKEALP